jgi:HEPN domain-containing protein
MTGTIRNLHAQMLYRLAQEDASTLQFPLPDQIYGFHAQQSCEKLFKALISVHDRAYPLTHNLERLIDLLEECGESLPPTPIDLILLEPFAVQLRYDLGASLSEVERVSIRESVGILETFVLSRILEIEGAGTR